MLLLLCALLALHGQEAIAQSQPKLVRVNGVDLHYVEQGSGIPVIFIHGGLDDYRVWNDQVGAFAQHYHAIAYSRRYNYPNSGSALDSKYSAITDADDLAALISKLGLAPAHVVGHSYGAYVALELAARHPQLVRSLVLAEPPLLRWLPQLEGGEPLFDQFMNTVWGPTTRGFRKDNEAGVTAAVNGFGELGYSGTDQKMTYAGLPAEVRQAFLENAREWKALTMSKDAFPELSFGSVRQIRAPTLLLGGQRSLKLADVIDRQLNLLLPDAQRVVLADATHEMWSEFPEKCRAATLQFLGEH
jgi:non-heme chloroperoxidase